MKLRITLTMTVEKRSDIDWVYEVTLVTSEPTGMSENWLRLISIM